MANPLRFNRYGYRVWLIPLSLPVMGENAYTRYKECLADRIDMFPSNDEEVGNRGFKPVEPKRNQQLSSTRHSLRYEAESAYWLLRLWAVRAHPKDEDPTLPEEHQFIDEEVWETLTGDRRGSLSQHQLHDEKVLHPAYKQLEDLIDRMADLIETEHEFTPDLIQSHEEYLHEAFQRLIFNFLWNNYDEPFMRSQRRAEDRQRRPKPKPANPFSWF